MSVFPRAPTPISATPLSVPGSSEPALRARPEHRAEPRRGKPLMRKYEVLHLEPNGDIGDFRRIAPATAAFEQAFASFARGTLISTARGTVAIEDLLPGDQVKTVEDGYQTLLWRGSMTVVPGVAGQRREMGTLTRLAADALGIARPLPDLVLGPCARLFDRSRPAQALSRGEGAYVPARDCIDGVNVIELTPPSPVQIYQLAFRDQQQVVANGVETESHHPGTLHELGLRGEVLRLYVSLFPWVERFDDFGPLRHPRLRMSDIELFRATAAGS